jgi:hypothetical protein
MGDNDKVEWASQGKKKRFCYHLGQQEVYKPRLLLLSGDSSAHQFDFVSTTTSTSHTTPQPTNQTPQTANMRFTLTTLTALLSLTSAAAVTKRYPATLVERKSGICGGLATALCCQTDVLGVANLNCANGTLTPRILH